MSSQNRRQRIVLASASPRRHELCQLLGLDCEIMPVDIDETPEAHESPLAFVERMAVTKATECVARCPANYTGLPVLGSDTVVECDGDILGKPRDQDHARKMLTQLSGRRHQVHTAIAISHKGQLLADICSSEVSFTRLEPKMIERYLATGEPMDKAGSYGIQGWAARFIDRLEGSYSGVMGLPLFETTRLFDQIGIEL